MMKFVSLTALALVLSAPAYAFDLKATIGGGKTEALSQGGAQSASGVQGGSAVIGGTTATSANVSGANGTVQATNTTGNLSNQSTVVQTHNSGSVSTMNSISLGFAGSGAAAGGQSASTGGGAAQGGYLGFKLQF